MRMLRVVLVFIAGLVTCAHATSAQQATMRAAGGDVLTLHDAVRAAARVHPTLQAARAYEDRADANVRELRASLLPAVTLESNATRFQEPMLVAPLHGFDMQRLPVFDRTLVQSSATVAYSVFDGGARGARLARASAQQHATRAQSDAALQALLADVTLRYAAVLVAREVLAAHDARVAALELERARARQLLEQGRAPRVVLLRAEASLSAALAEQSATRVRVDAAERELARVMGVDAAAVAGATLAPAAPSHTVAAREDAVQHALSQNAELRRLSDQAAAAHATVAEANAQWWPRLHFGGRYVHYASGAGDGVGEWQAGVQVSYPLFTAGARPAAIDRARAEEVAARAELQSARLRVADAVDRAYAAVDAARARAAAWQSAVVQMEEVARIERLALDQGAGVQTDWLSAQSELLRARASLVEARHDELVARVELARATGELTTAWIMDNVETVR